MPELDVLFIHPPRRLQHDWGRWFTSGLPLIPLGVLALADLCEQNGYSSRVLDIPLELAINTRWDFASYLRQNPARVYAIDLHWFATSYGAISTAQFCKTIHPDAQVLLGGHTASFFAEEILRNFPVVDAIIRGEAEEPLLSYLQAIRRVDRNPSALNQVPNLSYRKKGDSRTQITVHHNPITYVATEENLRDLNFVNLSLLDHWSQYLQRLQPYIPYCIMVARGCPFNCPFCSGSRISTAHITGRRTVLYRDPVAVAQDITTIADLQLTRRIFMGHGLYTGTNRFWQRVFREVQSNGADIGADLEIWRLPVSSSVLTTFKRTFDQTSSSLCFSLHAASYTNRKRLAITLRDPSHAHTDDQLQDLINHCKNRNLVLRLWMTFGGPFQDMSDIFRTFILQTSIARKSLAGKHSVQLFTEPINLSPGSPAYLFPQRFGVKLRLHNFTDYYQLYKTKINRFSTIDAPLAYETSQLPHSQIKLFTTLAGALNIPVFLSDLNRN